MTTRYHRDAFGLPPVSFSQLRSFRLTRHAAERIVEKRLPATAADVATLDARWSVFEATKEDGRLVKLAARRPIAPGLDLCAVFALDSLVVVTVWTNRSTDRHATLDRSLYSRP